MNIDHLQRVFIWEKAMAFENLIMKLDKKKEIFVSFVFYFFIFYKKIAVAAIVKGDQS